MTKEKHEVTAIELLELYQKPFCSTKDLMLITGRGETTCCHLRQAIIAKYGKGSIQSPTFLPMRYVFKYLNIDVDQLKESLR